MRKAGPKGPFWSTLRIWPLGAFLEDFGKIQYLLRFRRENLTTEITGLWMFECVDVRPRSSPPQSSRPGPKAQ
jgi:hypothetical protein